LPFQYILQLSFSYSNSLVLLGSNRILYAVVHQEENASLKPIFNHNQKHVLIYWGRFRQVLIYLLTKSWLFSLLVGQFIWLSSIKDFLRL